MVYWATDCLALTLPPLQCLSFSSPVGYSGIVLLVGLLLFHLPFDLFSDEYFSVYDLYQRPRSLAESAHVLIASLVMNSFHTSAVINLTPS